MRSDELSQKGAKLAHLLYSRSNKGVRHQIIIKLPSYEQASKSILRCGVLVGEQEYCRPMKQMIF